MPAADIYAAFVLFLQTYTRPREPVCSMCARPVDLYLDPSLCCGHVLHRDCVDEAWARYGKCPICKLEVSRPYGLELEEGDDGDITTTQWFSGLLLRMERECEVLKNKIRLEGVHNHAFCDHFNAPCLSESLEHRAPSENQEVSTWDVPDQSEGRRVGDIDEAMVAVIVERTIERMREDKRRSEVAKRTEEEVEEEFEVIHID